MAKLHRKDNPALYREVAAQYSTAQIEVIASDPIKFGMDIFDTCCRPKRWSQSAQPPRLDAMRVEVPVIAVAVNEGLKGVEFLERGCAIKALTARELADAARRVWNGETNHAVRRAAHEYINEHYANPGTATEHVAGKLCGLIGRRHSIVTNHVAASSHR